MSLSQQTTTPEPDSFSIGNIEVFPAQCTDSSFFVENGNENFLFVPAFLPLDAQRAEAVRAISEKGASTI